MFYICPFRSSVLTHCSPPVPRKKCVGSLTHRRCRRPPGYLVCYGRPQLSRTDRVMHPVPTTRTLFGTPGERHSQEPIPTVVATFLHSNGAVRVQWHLRCGLTWWSVSAKLTVWFRAILCPTVLSVRCFHCRHTYGGVRRGF